MLNASTMLYATRDNFGNSSHLSQNTVAIHLTLVQDPSIHTKDFNAHGKWNTQVFYTLPHRREPFVAHWNRQVDAPVCAHRRQSPLATHSRSVTGTFSHSSGLWPVKPNRDGPCNKGSTGEKPKTVPASCRWGLPWRCKGGINHWGCVRDQRNGL